MIFLAPYGHTEVWLGSSIIKKRSHNKLMHIILSIPLSNLNDAIIFSYYQLETVSISSIMSKNTKRNNKMKSNVILRKCIHCGESFQVGRSLSSHLSYCKYKSKKVIYDRINKTSYERKRKVQWMEQNETLHNQFETYAKKLSVVWMFMLDLSCQQCLPCQSWLRLLIIQMKL